MVYTCYVNHHFSSQRHLDSGKIKSCPSNSFLKSQNVGGMVTPLSLGEAVSWDSLLHCVVLRGGGVESGCHKLSFLLQCSCFSHSPGKQRPLNWSLNFLLKELVCVFLI